MDSFHPWVISKQTDRFDVEPNTKLNVLASLTELRCEDILPGQLYFTQRWRRAVSRLIVKRRMLQAQQSAAPKTSHALQISQRWPNTTLDMFLSTPVIWGDKNDNVNFYKFKSQLDFIPGAVNTSCSYYIVRFFCCSSFHTCSSEN